MTETSSIGDLIGPIVWLVVIFGVGKALFGHSSTPSRNRARSGGTAAVRRRELQMIRQHIGPVPFGRLSYMTPAPTPTISTATAVMDLADHPYEQMTLDNLYNHLFDWHFETWNLLGERNPLPAKWHKAHREDHYGLRTHA